jgi:hypothetical protein
MGVMVELNPEMVVPIGSSAGLVGVQIGLHLPESVLYLGQLSQHDLALHDLAFANATVPRGHELNQLRGRKFTFTIFDASLQDADQKPPHLAVELFQTSIRQVVSKVLTRHRGGGMHDVAEYIEGVAVLRIDEKADVVQLVFVISTVFELGEEVFAVDANNHPIENEGLQFRGLWLKFTLGAIAYVDFHEITGTIP